MTKATITTPLGNIVVQLYDETPQHRDNFVRLVQEGYYDGTIFHRVIREFMIQGGDPNSRNASPDATLGVGGPDYTIEAEILPHLFHKRGALAAARQGDEVNPERRSSGSQFYIVWGKQYSPAQLQQLEKQMAMQAEQQAFQRLANEQRDRIMTLRRNRDQAALMELQEQIIAQAKAETQQAGSPLSDAAKEVYAAQGGTPFLDGQYTVFGEVIEGLDIVEQIQALETRAADRPVNDVTMSIQIS